MALATDIRRAVWADIEAHADFISEIKRRYKFESAKADYARGEPQITVGDLPCVMLSVSSISSRWITNQKQEMIVTLSLELFTRWNDVLKGELLWEEFVKAMWADDTQLETVSGYPVQDIGAATVTPVRLGGESAELASSGGPNAMRWQWTVTAKTHWNPRTA